MTKRLITAILAATIAATSLSATPIQAADRGEIGRLIVGAGALMIIGSALANQNRDRQRDRDVVHRRDTVVTVTPPPPRRKVVPVACLRENRWDNGPRRFFGKRCLRNNMARLHRLPNHCERQVWTRNGMRYVFAARCLRKNGWVFG